MQMELAVISAGPFYTLPNQSITRKQDDTFLPEAPVPATQSWRRRY